MDLRGTGFGLAFITFAVAAGAAMPGVGAFHHPALGERDKASGTFRAFLHFDPPPGPLLLEPGLQVMSVILAIAKDDGEPREIVHADLGEELYGGGPLIERGARAQDDEQQPNRVHPHMAFAPVDFFAAVIPSLWASHWFCRKVDNNRLLSTFYCSFVTYIFQYIVWSGNFATEPLLRQARRRELQPAYVLCDRLPTA